VVLETFSAHVARRLAMLAAASADVCPAARRCSAITA
jgi:hypothetical protein